MQQYAGSWVITARALDGSRPFLVSPVTLTIPETEPSIDLWVIRGHAALPDTPERITLEIERRTDSLLARCERDGWTYVLEVRLAPMPGREPGDDAVLQGLVSCRYLDDPVPSEDTESFTGVRPGGM